MNASADPANPAAKSTLHRYSNLRAGAIKTGDGWNLKDWAISIFNPNAEDITVTWKLISDDPKFAFRNSVGTWTQTLKIPAMRIRTYNVYGPRIYASYDPTVSHFPVPALTNFTGSTEFSSSLPFYVYAGHQFETGESSGPDPDAAWYKAWDVWQNAVPAPWDSDLQQFVVPYTNYWHNVREWAVGWHSTLTIKNNTGQTVTYSIQHVVNYGILKNPSSECRIVDYQDQTVQVVLKNGEELNTSLENLYGWPTNQTSIMEGAILIRPNPLTAESGTSVSSAVVPNGFGFGGCHSGDLISVMISSPAPTVSGTVEVTANGVYTPFSGIEKVEFYVDGKLVATTTKAPYAFRWNTASVANGPHIITAKGYETGGGAAFHSTTMTVSNPPR
jgi:hypothetical protein